jgi:hypothetical protein
MMAQLGGMIFEVEERNREPAFGPLEAHKKGRREKGGTSEGLLTLKEGWCVCIYMVFGKQATLY